MSTYWARAQYDNVVLSQSPAVVLEYENFQDGMPPQWVGPFWQAPLAQTATINGERVLRHPSIAQRDVYTLSGATYNPGYGALWNQVFECRVRPIAYEAMGEASFGLLARYMNEGSLVYVKARANGHLELISRSLRGGEMVLDSTKAPLALNKWHTLRIEATDLNLRVYLNGRFVLQGFDPAPNEMGGRYGVLSTNAHVHFYDCLAQLP